MYLIYAFESGEEIPMNEIPHSVRGPFSTILEAFRGVEILKADCGNDNPIDSFDCHFSLQGAGPHSSGRMCIDFIGETSGLTLRIVEFVK